MCDDFSIRVFSPSITNPASWAIEEYTYKATCCFHCTQYSNGPKYLFKDVKTQDTFS